MKVRRTAALGAAGALVMALGACGGSDSDSGSSETTAAGAAGSTPAATQTVSNAEAPGGNGLTPPGTTLGLGEAATVGWIPPARFSLTDGQPGYRLQVTVKSIERGSIDDFKNIQLEDDQKSATPYYVAVSVKALEDVDPGTDDPDITFDAIDDRGQEQSNIIFIGEFERCPNGDVPRPFKAGGSYDSCLAYLMPGGGSIEKVQWRNGPTRANEVSPYFDKPVVWGGS